MLHLLRERLSLILLAFLPFHAFAVTGHDLRALLRRGASDEELAAAIADVWRAREDRYSELRSAETADLPKVEMSFIGG